MQQEWEEWLIPQDKHKLWPHITIQNKVSSEQAARLQQTIAIGFNPFLVGAIGLNLYEYQGGPWNFIDYFEFNKQQ